MVDADTGNQVGTMITGQENAVNLLPLLSSRAEGHRYVQFHTHPGSTSFSDVDAYAFLFWDQITAMVVLGVDGAWYVLSRDPHGSATSVDAADAFLIELDRLTGNFPDMSLRERTHRTWTHIAQRLGLRYDRVQRIEL